MISFGRLHGSADFMDVLMAERMLWLRGAFGSGKTSLSLRLAVELQRLHGFRICTSMPSLLSDDPSTLDWRPDGGVGAVLIMDEGGLWVRKKSQVDAGFGAYLAKLGLVVLFSTRTAPHADLQVLWCQRVRGFLTGNGMWSYVWAELDAAEQQVGSFHWFQPSRLWGVYPRLHPSEPSLMLHVDRWVAQMQRWHGVDARVGLDFTAETYESIHAAESSVMAREHVKQKSKRRHRPRRRREDRAQD